MRVEHQHKKLNICKWWLDRGFYLLPAQTDKKYLLQGWGEYRRQITNFEQAVKIFDHVTTRSNLAVLAPRGRYILDFDNPDLYASWTVKHPEIAKSYTERTPRGGAHVFLIGTPPGGLTLRDGVELKRVCLVHPSVVGGVAYVAGSGEILEKDPVSAFSSLSKPGHKTAYILRLEQDRPIPSARPSNDLIEQIKAYWSTDRVFQTYRPDIKLTPSGVMLTGCCPFHEDKRPSFFINTQTGFWKCHSCGASGDVINAYARFQGISNREAILRMAKALRGVAA